MKTIKYILLTLWTLPQNVLGLIIYLLCYIRQRDSFVYNGRVVTNWKLSSGVSLGWFIFIHANATADTLNHEYGHTRQSIMLGWFYLIAVGLPSIIWAGLFTNYRRRTGKSYYSIYPENWADKLGGVKRIIKK